MNPEEQRIEIAIACGWVRPCPDTHPKMWRRPKDGNWDGPFRHREGKGRWLEVIPDFLGDLNACAEMERALEPFQRDLYANILFDIIHPHQVDGADNEKYGAPQLAWPGVYQMICATAAQRCEAFLRTVGKWRE